MVVVGGEIAWRKHFNSSQNNDRRRHGRHGEILCSAGESVAHYTTFYVRLCYHYPLIMRRRRRPRRLLVDGDASADPEDLPFVLRTGSVQADQHTYLVRANERMEAIHFIKRPPR